MWVGVGGKDRGGGEGVLIISYRQVLFCKEY